MEFLIRAHDCYTLGCSVGGIADLLVMAQSTTNKLVAGKHFKLMVGKSFIFSILECSDSVVIVNEMKASSALKKSVGLSTVVRLLCV